jgi:DNA-binding response OmpR family regulator
MAEILIIDDEPALREVLSRALRTAGHTGHVAENGAAGIRLFHRLHPALVVTDIVMPEIEGIEVIRKLREADPTVPILAISGSGTPVYLRAAAGMGATATLAKPFEIAEFLTVVEGLLGTAVRS